MKYQIIYKPKGRIEPIEKVLGNDYLVNQAGEVVQLGCCSSEPYDVMDNQEDYEVWIKITQGRTQSRYIQLGGKEAMFFKDI